MKYLPTPMNIAAVLLIGIAIYSYFTAPTGGDGLQNVWVIPMIGVGLLILAADYFFQKYGNNFRRLVVVQGTILLILLIGWFVSNKTETFVLPNDFKKGYIVSIYDVENAPKIYGKWSLSYTANIPEDGILLTSSGFENDFVNTNFENHSGVALNINESMIRILPFDENEITCNGKSYKYRSWKVDDPERVYETSEIERTQLKTNLQKQCEQLLK